MGVAVGVIEIPHEGGAVVGSNEVDHHFGQVVLARNTLSFGHVGDDDLCSVTRVHRQQGVVGAVLVLGIVERVGHLTDIMVKSARTHEQRVSADGLRRLGSEVRDLHGVLESAGGFLCESVQEVGVDIRQLDQSDRGDETEEFLEGVNQSVTTDSEKAADSEIEVHPEVDRRPGACLRKSDGGICDHLREKDPRGGLGELRTARHV